MSNNEKVAAVIRAGRFLDRWCSWNNLWMYSKISVVKYASYLTLLIPIAAELVNFANAQEGHPATSTPWRIFAFDLYFAGLFLVAARLLVFAGCPARIKRFNHEDEHLIYAGEIRDAQAKIKLHVEGESTPAEANVAIDILERFFKELFESAAAANSMWREENNSRQVFRIFIGLLYTVGWIGVSAYFLWRVYRNIGIVWQFGAVLL
jgi:hypothetical protein